MVNQDDTIRIRKNTGELVPFDVEKLKNALRRSGARDKEIEKVTEEVRDSLYEGITTKKIYQIAYRTLRKTSKRTAGRYRLKKAIFQFGPSGYPFEFFVAKLLEFEGYKTETGQIVQGRCVQHEVDVVARKNSKLLMCECKFHQSESIKSDVKIPLYVHSRFNDIKEKWLTEGENKDSDFEPLLITNTRFTEDAMQFGRCTGMRLISWDYPENDSLKDWIDRSGFHPITSLKSLTKKEKQGLLDKGTVLCREIVEEPGLLDVLPITQRRARNIMKEAKALVE